jgi:hypothetical protein
MRKKTENKDQTPEEKMKIFLENFAAMKKEFSSVCIGFTSSLEKFNKHLFEMRKLLQAQEKSLEENNRVTQNVDESLGNVLLAIRQNEYLQAYYPAQLGFPEMKVTGKHPAKNI